MELIPVRVLSAAYGAEISDYKDADSKLSVKIMHERRDGFGNKKGAPTVPVLLHVSLKGGAGLLTSDFLQNAATLHAFVELRYKGLSGAEYRYYEKSRLEPGSRVMIVVKTEY